MEEEEEDDGTSSRSLEITDSEKHNNSSNWRPKRVSMIEHVAPKRATKRFLIRATG
jgi:hypothetical protein